MSGLLENDQRGLDFTPAEPIREAVTGLIP